MQKYYFGVFSKGKLVFQIGNSVYCSDIAAQVFVAILDTLNVELPENHYFACDYYGRQ